jgi:hypothetical protein
MDLRFKLWAQIFLACPSNRPAWPPLSKTGGRRPAPAEYPPCYGAGLVGDERGRWVDQTKLFVGTGHQHGTAIAPAVECSASSGRYL